MLFHKKLKTDFVLNLLPNVQSTYTPPGWHLRFHYFSVYSVFLEESFSAIWVTSFEQTGVEYIQGEINLCAGQTEVYLELDPKFIRLFVRHKCLTRSVIFHLFGILFMTIVKQNSENASLLRSDVCWWFYLEMNVSTSKGLEKYTKTDNYLSDLDLSAFCSCFIMHLW